MFDHDRLGCYALHVATLKDSFYVVLTRDLFLEE